MQAIILHKTSERRKQGLSYECMVYTSISLPLTVSFLAVLEGLHGGVRRALILGQWWTCWSKEEGITAPFMLRPPEIIALGLCEIPGSNHWVINRATSCHSQSHSPEVRTTGNGKWHGIGIGTCLGQPHREATLCSYACI